MHCSRFQLGAFLAGCALALSAGRAQAAAYYVSPAGDNTTGTAWSTAWNELNQIQWSTVKAGDTIQIDGGTAGGSITYKTTLTFPATAPAVEVGTTTQSGHNGVVILDGKVNTSGPGISILGSANLFSRATGKSTGQLLLQNFSTAVNIKQPSTATLNMDGLTFISDTIGVYVANVPSPTATIPAINSCIFQDCASAGIYNASANPIQVSYSWFHNTNPPQQYGGTPCAGVYGLNQSNYCVYGPYLNYGIFTATNTGANVSAKDCLFLDCFLGNFRLNEGAGNLAFPGGIEYCTAYMTQLNPYNVAHSNFYGNGLFSVGASVFYGGAIIGPVGTSDFKNQPPNDQYNVTGNTSALARTQTDPQFVDSTLYSLSNQTTATTLINKDFSVKQSVGSTLTSVSQLLQLMLYP